MRALNIRFRVEAILASPRAITVEMNNP